MRKYILSIAILLVAITSAATVLFAESIERHTFVSVIATTTNGAGKITGVSCKVMHQVGVVRWNEDGTGDVEYTTVEGKSYHTPVSPGETPKQACQASCWECGS